VAKDTKVSLFASAIRTQLWPALFKSLEGTNVEYEVVFAGNNEDYFEGINKYKSSHTYSKIDKLLLYREIYIGYSSRLRFIHTRNIKPAQCYEIARRNCTGEVVVWIADDCEFVGDVIGKAYTYWKSQNNEKLILSLQTKESGYGCKDGKLYPMKEHTFYSMMPETSLMAPIAMISRKFINEIGGFDRRFICGQYENMCIKMAYERGAKVEIFGDENCYVDIDHLAKSIAIGESTDEESFKERPFAKGYHLDRQVLENSWTTFDPIDAFKRLDAGERPISLRRVSKVQLDKFEPYSDPISLTKSEGNNIAERWE
jgi:hypothetical protein